MTTTAAGKSRALTLFLRIYGVLTLVIFISLFVGVAVESPILAEQGGPLNWTIWNDVKAGNEMNHVPLMLFVVYIVWGVFFFLAARNPTEYGSFLSFTAWANLAHGVLMIGQTLMDLDRYWSKFLTDIPFILILPLAIYLLRSAWMTTSSETAQAHQPAHEH
ncbi:DUF6632 domain-containing protein [Mycolicibacterium sp. CBMA 226]|uniref:DUF6632 domain-containing protein n=1 Tax=Mycolicibacterium sp. CBMA 226 TaxID=2606611 RepID=UPI0012DBCB5F|nr:DUF6632 domain-containing protein [Mycolicibacterium sp. CBMA 226]MUL75107.1 hypothetical protein [Mycolicibacterium sp. CBMA 226]